MTETVARSLAINPIPKTMPALNCIAEDLRTAIEGRRDNDAAHLAARLWDWRPSAQMVAVHHSPMIFNGLTFAAHFSHSATSRIMPCLFRHTSSVNLFRFARRRAWMMSGTYREAGAPQ